LNIAVWIVWRFANPEQFPPSALFNFMHENFLLHPAGVLHEYRIYTLITSAFSHISITHILFNLLFLWFLAEDVERIYGYRNMLWLYIFTALCSSLAYIGLEALKTGGDFSLAHSALGAS